MRTMSVLLLLALALTMADDTGDSVSAQFHKFREIVQNSEFVEKRMKETDVGTPQTPLDLFVDSSATVIGFYVHNTEENLFKGDLGSSYKGYHSLVCGAGEYSQYFCVCW